MPIDYSQAARLAYLQWLDAVDSAELEWIRTLRDYAVGDHPTYLTDRQKEFIGLLPKNTDHLFSHNLCALIIATVAERMAVTGFSTADADEASADQTPLALAASHWWETNRMDALQDDLYEAALRDGSAYLIVDWDPIAKAPRWYLNDAFDGTTGVQMFYDPETGSPMFAAKRWVMDARMGGAQAGLTRLTLYFPDRVERYVQRTGKGRADDAIDNELMRLNWRTYRDAPGEEWPRPWVDSSGAPLGMPAIAFDNPGGSEIESVVSLQDLLNKSDLDLIAAADHSGFRILYASGLQPTLDSSGEEQAITLSPGHLLRITDPQGKLGAVEPGDLTRMIDTCHYWIESIAAQSRTPHHVLIPPRSDQPSGAALKEQEVGLLSKCERKARAWGNAWEDVLYLSARLSNTYGGTAMDLSERLQTQWGAIQTASEKEHAEIAALKQAAGVAAEMTWAEDLGMTAAEIERNLALKDEAQQRQVATFGAVAARAARLRDQGMEV